MKTATILTLCAALMTGCTMSNTPGPGGPPVAIEADSISYATSPCFGTCPVYRVSVRPDGSGVFEGMHHTAVTGERRFTVTPAQYRAFEAHLAPLRPEQGEVRLTGGEACSPMATDLPGVEVIWTRAIGDYQVYQLNFGCNMERNGAAAERLRGAPRLLPIQAFIGQR